MFYFVTRLKEFKTSVLRRCWAARRPVRKARTRKDDRAACPDPFVRRFRPMYNDGRPRNPKLCDRRSSGIVSYTASCRRRRLRFPDNLPNISFCYLQSVRHGLIRIKLYKHRDSNEIKVESNTEQGKIINLWQSDEKQNKVKMTTWIWGKHVAVMARYTLECFLCKYRFRLTNQLFSFDKKTIKCR